MSFLLKKKYNQRLIKFKQFLLEKRIVTKKLFTIQRKIYLKQYFNKIFFKVHKQLKLNKQIFFNVRKNKRKYIFLKKLFYICLKKTKSNFFCFFINYKNCFISLSIGQTQYKGPIKLSIDAFELLGYKFGFRLFKFYLFLLKRKIIMFLILLITFRIFKGLKKFLKKFLTLGLRFFFIFILYKFAHNGCRKKNAKRR